MLQGACRRKERHSDQRGALLHIAEDGLDSGVRQSRIWTFPPDTSETMECCDGMLPGDRTSVRLAAETAEAYVRRGTFQGWQQRRNAPVDFA
jgi:hypothetical protein